MLPQNCTVILRVPLGCSLIQPLPATPPRLHSRKQRGTVLSSRPWPLVFDVMDSRFGRFCVFSAGKTNFSEKPQVEHWGEKDKKKTKNKTNPRKTKVVFVPTQWSQRGTQLVSVPEHQPCLLCLLYGLTYSWSQISCGGHVKGYPATKPIERLAPVLHGAVCNSEGHG